MRKPKAPQVRSRAQTPPNGRIVAPDVWASAQEARQAGLRYVSDETAGITRKAAGKGWRFFDSRGHRIVDVREVARIRRLAIPPAWTDVWICPRSDGHIQAIGRDQRGRKQYRYHDDWRATRDATKYARMAAFGRALPRIRRRVSADLRRRGLGREKVLAAMVRLLEATLIRVGNEEYARDNGSYGLSTLRNRHAKVRGGKVTFRFTGKSGQRHEIDLRDPRLAGIVARVQDLPGQELFAYETDDGRVVDVKSDDVNAYLREVAGEEFSAKDFRTWSGTVMAAVLLAAEARTENHRPTKKNLAAVVKKVAEHLGNTPSVCRKCYIHPVILDAYLAGETVQVAKSVSDAVPRARNGLSATEKAVRTFLEKKAKQPKLTLAEQLERSVKAGGRRPVRGRTRKKVGRRPALL